MRDFFININKEVIWTKLQGEVYGKYIYNAKPYKNFKKAIKNLNNNNFEKYIISHKTKFPYLGRKYNLHKSASKWLFINDFFVENKYFKKKKMFFLIKPCKKISIVKELKCDYFIDDSIEVLKMLPKNINKILFDPSNNYKKVKYKKLSDWKDLYKFL